MCAVLLTFCYLECIGFLMIYIFKKKNEASGSLNGCVNFELMIYYCIGKIILRGDRL